MIRPLRSIPLPSIACLILLLPLQGCTKFNALNALVPACGYTRTADLTYGDLPRQRLDVYRPHNAAPGAPVVIFFYGGYWQYGSKDDYRFVAEAITSRGFVAVLADYRLYPAVKFPAFVEDGARAVRWTHDNIERFGGDPQHVYLMGHSAGAHIVALLTLDGHYLKDAGLDRNAIRATVGISGPYDFLPGAMSRPVFNMTPADTAADPNIEPIHFAGSHAPPLLLLHGARDETIEAANSSRLADRIQQSGGDARAIFYPRLGHASVVLALARPFRWLAPVLRDATTFFREH
ncbi:MAG: esterase/lipase/thioesterase family protein [Phycisphaerales bacterium]|nr:esterase/lipase/thioesterase family protein [Phycisphaerales bacterium]